MEINFVICKAFFERPKVLCNHLTGILQLLEEKKLGFTGYAVFVYT